MGVRETNFAVFLVWMLVTSLMYLVGALFMHVRRQYQPIKARDAGLSLLTNFGFLASTVLRCLITMVPSLPCLIDIWEVPISIGFVTSIFLLRSWRMFFKFELAHERSMMRSRGQDGFNVGEGRQTRSTGRANSSSGMNPIGITGPSWFSDHRYLISDRANFTYTVFMALWFFVPALIISAQGHLNGYSVSVGPVLCNGGGTFQLWTVASGVALLFGLLYFAVRLRRTFDAFGIKTELMTIFFLLIASWVTVTGSVPFTTFNDEVFAIRKLLPLIYFVFLFFFTTVVPVYRSFSSTSADLLTPSNADQNEINTLPGILQNPDAFHVFQQYLIGCFCVESCLFWKEIEQFRAGVVAQLIGATKDGQKKLHNLNAILVQINDINENYIMENSQLQVNISAGQRQKVELAVSRVNEKYKEEVESEATHPHETPEAPQDVNIGIDDEVKRSEKSDFVAANNPGRGLAGAVVTEDDEIDPELKSRYKDVLIVFNVAQMEVFELMRTDPFPRFKNTKAFSQIVSQVNLQTLQRKELKDLNII